jgi:hypothetical protein
VLGQSLHRHAPGRPEQRGFGQTPFNVGQCRRDCPSFRAVEDRLQNILDFFASAESDETDLPPPAPTRAERRLRPRRPGGRPGEGVRQGPWPGAARCLPKPAPAAIRASPKPPAGPRAATLPRPTRPIRARCAPTSWATTRPRR